MAEPRKAAEGATPVRRFPRHAAFFIALAIGLLAFATSLWLAPAHVFAAGANAMFVGYLGLILLAIPRLTPDLLRRHADAADAPAWAVILIVLLAVAISIAGLFGALQGEGPPALVDLAIGIFSVVLGWFAVHVVWALHYAYEFYESPASAEKDRSGPHVGGLDFPGRDWPDGFAFLYFSLAIGTSTATSDVAVTSNKMRSLVMVHSVLSFLFNTLIVAAAVNVVVAVGAG